MNIPEKKNRQKTYKQFTKEEIVMVNNIWGKAQPSCVFSEIPINIKDLVRMWEKQTLCYIAGRGSNLYNYWKTNLAVFIKSFKNSPFAQQIYLKGLMVSKYSNKYSKMKV